ncbi:hypothetical protein P0136_07695 [Lentisphaerota bacterium ZTH]|nr:hypothetical protein JYG24_01190 [Lentisphaerota bacterium]WET05253.1 hypothetical protein P0136_07695 [Lentisphaerota bacterium ZTH]
MEKIFKKGIPMSQEKRPVCSLPLNDADLRQHNCNWTKGLQAMTDWIWSGNLNPEAFPNNLGKYLLHIPGVLEQQLNYSTTLLFDEPSFRNGVQISGFLDRPLREMIISYIGQLRRCWYTMTHHAVLGKLTFSKHGIPEKEFELKYSSLLEYKKCPDIFSPLEMALLDFAHAFATNPRFYTDDQFNHLKKILEKENQQKYVEEALWMTRLQAARKARAAALAAGESPDSVVIDELSRKAAQNVTNEIPADQAEIHLNAQLVELSFVCLQFVALTDVFSALNIPDEDFMSDVMQQNLPAKVISRINELNKQGMAGLIPQLVSEENEDFIEGGRLFEAVLSGKIKIMPAEPKGQRIPFTPYEGRNENSDIRPAWLGAPDRDKGLTVGGIQVGVYGWSFGGYFPGNLPYTLIHHPELARYEAPYSLPLLFNEDEWRNGVNTGGYVSSKIKEMLIQKVYRLNRSRYGVEHHTMFYYNTFLDEYGVGRSPQVEMDEKQRAAAREMALEKAKLSILYIVGHEHAPEGIYSSLEKALLSWAEQIIRKPQDAHIHEPRVREELSKANKREIRAGLRKLDTAPALTLEAALERLINHQIAEMVMVVGHMDGLARAMTMLQLEAEGATQIIEGAMDSNGNIEPELNKDKKVKYTGYFNNRPGLHTVLRNFINVDPAVLTINELLLNPELCDKVKQRLKSHNGKINITSKEALKTANF